MKYIIPVSMALLVLLFANFTVKQSRLSVISNSDTLAPKSKTVKQNKKEPAYDFPPEVTTDTGRASFIKLFNKGEIIYRQTCAKCHNVIRDGKAFYPDFSLPQLIDYEMRFQYPEHQEDLKDTNITEPEMDWVVLFLRYKKKNLLLEHK